MKSYLSATKADGSTVVCRFAPEGFEYTGEFRVPGPSEYWHDGSTLTEARQGGTSVGKFLLRRLKTAKERRADELCGLIGHICFPDHRLDEYVESIEKIFERQKD